MKNPQVRMLAYYLLGLVAMGVSVWVLASVRPVGRLLGSVHWLVALLPAILVCVIAIVLYSRAAVDDPVRMLYSDTRRALYRICYALNAVASGFAVGAMMAQKGMQLTADLLPSLIPAVVLGLTLFLLFCVKDIRWRKVVSIVFVVLSLVLVILSLLRWLHDSDIRGCIVLFSVLFFLLFPVGMYHAAKNPDNWLKYLAFTGFGAFAVIFFVVLVILSDGSILDGLDGVDLDFGSGGKSKKK